MNIILLASISAFIASLLICAFVFIKSHNSPKRRVFIAIALLAGTWCLFPAGASLFESPTKTLLVVKFVYIAALFTGPAFLSFVLTIIEAEKQRFEKNLIVLSHIGAALFLPILFSPFMIKNVIKTSTYTVLVVGPTYAFFIAFFALFCLYSLYRLLIFYKNTSGQRKNQIKYIFIAYFMAFLSAVMHFGASYGLREIFPHDVLVIGCMLVLAYAIFAHKLMDIEVVIRKTLLYSILITIITVIYFIVIYLLERVFSAIVGYRSIASTITIIALFSIIFTPLKNRIQHTIDNYFFKGSIDQIEKEKDLLGAELERSERLKAVSTLAAGMAHEIKNPLTSIKTFVEYAYKKDKDPEFRAKFKKIVPSEIDKITNIINQLLDYTKTQKTSQKPCNIHNMLNYVLDLYNNVFINKQIRLVKEYSAKSPIIKCDENQLKQAFINIIQNSIESIDKQGEITIRTANLDGFIELSIQDTGMGIPEDKVKHLFDPFYTTKEQGAGLGLFVVHQIIENHKGKIAIDSWIGKGTVVIVRFPQNLP